MDGRQLDIGPWIAEQGGGIFGVLPGSRCRNIVLHMCTVPSTSVQVHELSVTGPTAARHGLMTTGLAQWPISATTSLSAAETIPAR